MARALVVRLAAFAACALIGLPATAAEPAAVSRANEKWREAQCTLRIPVELKRGKNREGWTRSRIYSSGMLHTPTATGIQVGAATAKGESPFFFTMEVSDREALAGILSGETVPPGTRFIAEGWMLARPQQQQGPYLQLRFAELPNVKARFWFLRRGSFGGPDSFPIKQFEPIERYLRIEAFALRAANEELTSVAPAPGSVARQPHAPSPSQPTQAATLFSPSVRLLAVSCQPAQVRAGDEVDLVLTYLVDGIPPAASFEVVERREILDDEQVTGSFQQPLGRAAGTFTSTQRVRIPETARPALYTVRGTVTMAGISSSATALLDVRGR